MSLPKMTINKIQNMLAKINSTTGENSQNLLEAVDVLIEKFLDVSMFVEAVAGEPGTINNPIPYQGNMSLQTGKYYFQNNEIFLCNISSENRVYHPLSELTEYVQKIS